MRRTKPIRRHYWQSARGDLARRRVAKKFFEPRTTRFGPWTPTANLQSATDADRIHTAFKWAEHVLWEWGPETGGQSDDRTLAALCLIFCDSELLASSEATRHPLAAAVRDIRMILARKDGDPPLPSRQILNALCQQSALDAPWPYAALAKQNNRPVLEPTRPDDTD